MGLADLLQRSGKTWKSPVVVQKEDEDSSVESSESDMDDDDRFVGKKP